ncbi:MAG: AtpZ/AtpI family protein, partial [Desulfomonilia bacterium]
MSEAPFIKRPRRGIFKRKTRDSRVLEDLAIVTQLGLTMAGSIGLCMWIGYTLDGWLHAHGIILTIFILLGIAGGGWTAYRQI